MGPLLTGKTTMVCLTFVCLMPLLSGCGGGVGGDFEALTRERGALTVQQVSPPPSGAVVVAGLTTPDSRRLIERPRHNPQAADLLDHWGHRQAHGMVEGLALSAPTASDSGADLRALRTAAQGGSETLVPDLQDGDAIDVLGVHRGVTYGRWTGGPGDTLSIEFDLSRAAPKMRDDPEVRAMLERAGKVWSHRIADTWRVWERPAGDLKGWLHDGTEVRVGPGGEISTGVEIDVVDADVAAGFAGQAKGGVSAPGAAWEPRFGTIEIDRTHLQEAGEAELFATLAHEIGHVLGAWMGDNEARNAHTDTTAGAWSGPNVVAVHGGPAPFQDASDPNAPLASPFDFAHSGVCASLMAYCRQNTALPAFLPHAIDVAFLADLGMTVTGETNRPETYGLAGWTDYAAFTLSLSRELQIALAEPQPYYDGAVNPWRKLDVIDLLQAEADVFGYRSTGDVRLSHAALGLSGTARYAGGLIGAALDRQGMPPVTGDASLALDLGTLNGTASFTSLQVYPDGVPEPFAAGALHYPFALSDNAIVGSGAALTLRADFYGPGHEDVAGVLHDPRAGLLASFGATTDDRPSRQDVIAAADYVAGMTYQRGSALATDNGWYDYRCQTDATCASRRHAGAAGWTDWTTTTRDTVLAATAGWNGRGAAWPDSDRGFVRIARQTSAATDGKRGRHAVDGYTGALAHSAFGVGFEQYTDGWAGPGGVSPGFGTTWAGFQGASSASLPRGTARWSGPMLGYQGALAGGANPFVTGRATVRFALPGNQVDVLFSEVASRDGQRTLADFGFEALRAQADGTFRGGGQTGSMDGAFFGPAHAEAAGSFHHNATHVTGSFGARRLPDTVTLAASGTHRRLGGSDGSHFYAFDSWGFWGRQFQENVFGAFVEQTTRQEGRTTYYDAPFGRIAGTPSGYNPVAGTAVWSGKVRAFDTHADDPWAPVSGTARLEVDFATATVDVDLTDFASRARRPVVAIAEPPRRRLQPHPRPGHHRGRVLRQRASGRRRQINRDRLQGVFGAVRQ